jgi:hypothetical protein
VAEEVVQRQFGIDLFNHVSMRLAKRVRTQDDDDILHASTFHRSRAPGVTAANHVGGEWQWSRVYDELGCPEPALHNPRRALELGGVAPGARAVRPPVRA